MLFLIMKKVILGATGSIGSSLAKKARRERRSSSFSRKREKPVYQDLASELILHLQSVMF